jgi:hypothetical protein
MEKLCTKYLFTSEKKCGKLIILIFFKFQRPQFHEQSMDQNKIRTLSLTWYTLAKLCLVPYLKAWTKKVRKTYLLDWWTVRQTANLFKVPFNFIGRVLKSIFIGFNMMYWILNRIFFHLLEGNTPSYENRAKSTKGCKGAEWNTLA